MGESTWTLITGASGGIGRELAEIFAESGHNLILVARSEGKLAELRDRLTAEHGVEARVIAADLSLPDAAERLHERTQGLVVDNLVNNAGFGDWGGFLDSDWGRQEQMVQLNITALMQMCRLYGRDMRERGFGHILNLSSVAAFCAGPYMSVYYATKAYVLSFSQALSEELADTGVTATALCPGPTSTGFESAARMKDSKMFTALHPAKARDVAQRGYDAMQEGKAVAYHSTTTTLMNIGSRLFSRRAARRFAAGINGHPQEAEGLQEGQESQGTQEA